MVKLTTLLKYTKRCAYVGLICSTPPVTSLAHAELLIKAPILNESILAHPTLIKDLTIFYPLTAPSAAYQAECADEAQTIYNDVTINNTNQVDVYRCVRRLFGSNSDFKMDPEDFRFYQVGFPYLERIDGNLIVKGGNTLDELYFQRLKSIQGDIQIDLTDELEYVQLSELSSANNISIELRANNSDLTGLDNLTSADAISITNDVNDSGMFLNGFNGLTNLDNLRIYGGSITNYDDNDGDATDATGLFESLLHVNNDVTIEVDGGMNHLYGVSALQSVGDDLTIRYPDSNDAQDGSNLTNLDGLGALQTVTGHFAIYNTPNLTSLDGIGNLAVGGLVIEGNSALNDITALNSVSVVEGGYVSFDDNGSNLTCSEINNFINALPETVIVNNPDC